MDATNGQRLNDIAHIKQSIQIILTTPIGSRVMRRDFGSHFFDLVDYLGNTHGLMLVKAALVSAILKWEPRVTISGIQLSLNRNGKLVLELSGQANSQPWNEQFNLQEAA